MRPEALWLRRALESNPVSAVFAELLAPPHALCWLLLPFHALWSLPPPWDHLAYEVPVPKSLSSGGSSD